MIVLELFLIKFEAFNSRLPLFVIKIIVYYLTLIEHSECAIWVGQFNFLLCVLSLSPEVVNS